MFTEMTSHLHLIRTDADYREALTRIDELVETAQPGTPEGDETEVLILLVKQYEDQQYPIAPPDPITAIQLRMERLGLRNKNLEPYLGPKGNVSKILNRQRPLTVEMMRKLHRFLGIPAEVLLA